MLLVTLLPPDEIVFTLRRALTAGFFAANTLSDFLADFLTAVATADSFTVFLVKTVSAGASSSSSSLLSSASSSLTI
jgi:hypothetical protein